MRVALLVLALGCAAGAAPTPEPPPAWMATALARLPYPADVVPDLAPPASRTEAARRLAIWVEWGLPAPLDPGPAMLATALAPELAGLDPAPADLAARLADKAPGLTGGIPRTLRGAATLERVAESLRRLEEIEARRTELVGRAPGRVEDRERDGFP